MIELYMHPVCQDGYYLDPAAADIVKNPNMVPITHEGEILTGLARHTPAHGRSLFEKVPGRLFTSSSVTDGEGNIYQAISIKGCDAISPSISYSSIEPSYVRVNGMLDASTFERCHDVSTILRQHGVLTEWPFFHARPKEFPVGHRLSRTEGLQQFRTRIYNRYIEKMVGLRGDTDSMDQAFRADSIGRAGLIGAALSELQFGVMYRATLSHSRLWDIDHMQRQQRENNIAERRFEEGELHFRQVWTEATLASEVTHAISALQTRQPDFACLKQLQNLNPESAADHDVYLKELLPALMGENLARLHNSGAFHKYLHGGNWTLAGEIVDLDSVRHPDIDPADEIDFDQADILSEVIDSATTLQAVADLYPTIGPKELFHQFIRSYAMCRKDALDYEVLEYFVDARWDGSFLQASMNIDYQEVCQDKPKILDLYDPELEQLGLKYHIEQFIQGKLTKNGQKPQQHMASVDELYSYVGNEVGKYLFSLGIEDAHNLSFRDDIVVLESTRFLYFFTNSHPVLNK